MKMQRFSFIMSCSSDFLLFIQQRGQFNSNSVILSYWCLKHTPHAMPPPPKKVPEWLVSSFTCALMSLPCPSSSPGGSVDRNLPRLDWGKGSDYCERKFTSLYLGKDCCFNLAVIQTNTVIVIWQFTFPLRHVNSLSGKRVRINLLSTQTYFTMALKKDSIIYYCRYFAQQKVLFLLFFYFFIFENSLSWRAVCYCWTWVLEY